MGRRMAATPAAREMGSPDICEAIARDHLIGRVVAVLGDAIEFEAGPVQAGRSADADVPGGVASRHAKGDVAQRIAHLSPTPD